MDECSVPPARRASASPRSPICGRPPGGGGRLRPDGSVDPGHAKQSTASVPQLPAASVPEYDASNPRGQRRAAIMSAPQNAGSRLTSAPENDHPADPKLLAKLQQTATLANENCDRATALVRTLSSELRDAQQRIRDLEREANRGLEAEAALAELHAEFDARVDQAKQEAEERVRRKLTETENHLTRLQTELARARQRTAEASGRVVQIEKEANERIARAEAEADERIRRAGVESEAVFARVKREAAEARQRAERTEAEADQVRREADEQIRLLQSDAATSLEQLRAGARDEVSRLQFELAEAEDRAKRAEQWVARIRQEVEGALMRSSATGQRAQCP